MGYLLTPAWQALGDHTGRAWLTRNKQLIFATSHTEATEENEGNKWRIFGLFSCVFPLKSVHSKEPVGAGEWRGANACL
jgi:hypothetical protein